MWEISLPPSQLLNGRGQAQAQAQAAANEVKQMAVKGCEVFSMVLEKLCALSTEAEACKQDGTAQLQTFICQFLLCKCKCKIECKKWNSGYLYGGDPSSELFLNLQCLNLIF